MSLEGRDTTCPVCADVGYTVRPGISGWSRCHRCNRPHSAKDPATAAFGAPGEADSAEWQEATQRAENGDGAKIITGLREAIAHAKGED